MAHAVSVRRGLPLAGLWRPDVHVHRLIILRRVCDWQDGPHVNLPVLTACYNSLVLHTRKNE